MKTLVVAAAIILGWCSYANGATPATLTSLSAVTALSNADASLAIPVSFEATVSYARLYENVLFVQDGSAAIFVRPPAGLKLVQGDRILVKGKTKQSFRPIVVSESITVLHPGTAPKPIPSTFEELIRGQNDSTRISIRATIRAADLVLTGGPPVQSTRVQMVAEAGHFELYLNGYDAAALKDLLDAEVEVSGVAAGKFDSKMQQTGVVVYVSSLGDIKVLARATTDPWTLPFTSMDRVLGSYHMHDMTPRVRVRGVITYFQPGSAMVLQDGARSLWISTQTREPLLIGDRAEATGFPNAHERLLTLNDAQVVDSHVFDPVTPQAATWHQLAFWSSNTPSGHQNDLVSIEGEVETEVREALQDEYVLKSDGRLFTAVYRHPVGVSLPPMMQISTGAKVRITGICVVADPNSVSPDEEIPFNILLRSFDAIAIVASPSVVSVRNLMIVAGVLMLVVIVVGAWGWILRAKVRRQTGDLAAMAQFEQRRSRALEDINGTRPLNEIVTEITEMVSSTLHGAPCWCEIPDGDTLGNRPPNADCMRQIQVKVGSRNGPVLGSLIAGISMEGVTDLQAQDALAGGARLAMLAIETRRHYSDLRHRSEYDLLTGSHNRFSFERHLDARIDEARQNGGIVGLVYIDFDHFKSVNDIYGHHVGDLFLQEAAMRMKRQLRTVDILGRLGGDEFVALVPLVRSRADVEEIAHRLQHCFDPSFLLEGVTLEGSTSVGISLFPEDSTTREGLLSAADAAMYASKYSRRRIEEIVSDPGAPGSSADVRS
jgi:diguanylate cyclase (GGDEF)-like protein